MSVLLVHACSISISRKDSLFCGNVSLVSGEEAKIYHCAEHPAMEKCIH